MEAILTTPLQTLPRDTGNPAGPTRLLHLAGLMLIVLVMAAASFGCGALTAAARGALANGRKPSGEAALKVEARPSTLNSRPGALPKANRPVGADLRVSPSAVGPSAVGPSAVGPSADVAAADQPLLPASPGYAPQDYVPPAGAALPTPTPLALPEYEIPEPAPEVFPTAGAPAQLPEADTSAVTRLVIPRMTLDAVVKYVPFSNSTWLIGGLRHEIAWMGDTSWPGLGSNTGLAGHYDFSDGSPGPFWRLSELADGDPVQVYTEQYLYTYTVRERTLVDDSDLSVIAPTDNPQITLITCAGWDPAQRVYTQRLIVYADLTAVNPLR